MALGLAAEGFTVYATVEASIRQTSRHRLPGCAAIIPMTLIRIVSSVDPNNGVQMYESDEIVDYLYTTYTDSETSHFEEA